MVGYARPHKVTPSTVEESAWEDLQSRRRITDANGIPFQKVTYRKRDADLLGILVRKAFASWRDALLTKDRLAEVARLIDARFAERFPASDMAVFERYGCTAMSDTANVQIEAGPRSFQNPVWIKLPVARALPLLSDGRRTLLVAQVDGLPLEESDPRIPVPEATISYFSDVVRVRQDERRQFLDAGHWASVFRAQEDRFPRWEEIAEAFPLFGEWLDMRRQARGS